MNFFVKQIEKYLVPLAQFLNGQKYIASIRDAFITVFPLTMGVSMVTLINNLILSKDGLIAKMLFLPKLFPNIDQAQAVFARVGDGTLNVMSIFIAFLVAEILSKKVDKEADSRLMGMISIACFLILYPGTIYKGDTGLLPTTYLGSQGLFVAIIVGCVIGRFGPKLASIKKMQIKMPEQVPPAVSKAFISLIPMVIILLLTAIVSWAFSKVSPDGINGVIYSGLQAPLRKVGANMFGVYLITLMTTLLWAVGIHGDATMQAVISLVFAQSDLADAKYVLMHNTVVGVPYPETFSLVSVVYGTMGGTGMTLGLIIALLIASKRSDYREVAKFSLVPGLFNINEPLIFGLPIVLNPIMIVPFILAPLVSVFIAHMATFVLGIIPSAAISVPWTIPGPLMPFLGTGGNWMALVVGIVCMVSSIFVYLPFVIASNKLDPAKEAN